MDRKYKYTLIAFIAILLLYALFRFFGKQAEHNVPPVSVVAAEVVQRDVDIIVKVLGTVEPYATVEIKSMVTGPIAEVGFKEGDLVQKGQILFILDERSFIAALNAAKAQLLRDEATRTNNELLLKRHAQLVKQGYTSKQDYDTFLSNAKAIAATVQGDQATVDNAQLQLEYATIRAPIAGKTGNITLKVGSVVKANDTVSLVTINQINPIYVTFTLPQTKFAAIQSRIRQSKIMIKVITSDKKIETGELSFIDNTINTTTGSITLKGIFANENQNLWPGQYVTVEIPVESLQQAVLIPTLALLTGQRGFYVYVVDEKNIVHIRDVVPGDEVENLVVIIKGLHKGERVVTAGQLAIQDGTAVVIRQ